MGLHNWMLAGYLLFVALNAIDLWITKVILSHPKGVEHNPVMRWLHKHMGMFGMVIIKAILLSWFGIQYYFKILDLYTIFYLNFMFTVVLIFMVRDALQAGLKVKLNPFNH